MGIALGTGMMIGIKIRMENGIEIKMRIRNWIGMGIWITIGSWMRIGIGFGQDNIGVGLRACRDKDGVRNRF